MASLHRRSITSLGSAMRAIAFILLGAALAMTSVAAPIANEIDAYLSAWDRFAQGDNSLRPTIREGKERFEASLADALNRRDPAAPSRVVFYSLVQVGGAISVESQLGRAWKAFAGPSFPVARGKEGSTYFAADLYVWWKTHPSPDNELPLLSEWATRDWPKKSLIPMYERIATYHP